MRRTVDTQAIAIQRYSYAETSQIVHFLSETHGRIVVLVRGAYREKNSYQGPIDLLVRSRLKVSFVKGRELGLLTARQVETAYLPIRRDYSRYRVASDALRLVVAATVVGQTEPGIFRLLDRLLLACCNFPRERLALVSLAFDLRLLRILGLNPHLHACVRCSSNRGLVAYQASDGGMVCRKCRQPGISSLPMSKEVWMLLQDLQDRTLRDISSPSEVVERKAQRLVDAHLAYHLEWKSPGEHRTPRLSLNRRRRKRA